MDPPPQPARTKPSASETPKQRNPTLDIFSPAIDPNCFQADLKRNFDEDGGVLSCPYLGAPTVMLVGGG